MSNQAACPVSATLNEKIIIDAGSASLTPKQPEICKGASIELTAAGGVSYSWSPSDAINNPTASSVMASPLVNSKYIVEVTNQFGCKKKDSVFITVRQPFNIQLVTDTFVCAGSQVPLPATGAASYQWINNMAELNNSRIASPVARPVSSTTYTVVGTDAYNCFTDTAKVFVNVKPLPSVNIGADMQVAGGDPVPLTATYSNNVVSWNWSPSANLSCTNCALPMGNPGPETRYILTVKTSFGCEASDTMIAKLVCDESRVLVPNAFTPNGDGVNDVFSIRGSGTLVRHFKVYGRWGNVVFEKSNFSSNDRSAGWNGMINGEPASVGTYVYMIEMQCATGQVFSRKGTVVLAR
jgi:gliding motility-associated-like protein